MSEKLDGVRAYWDGKRLISRQGHPFTPPADYTRNFPPYPIDGELYTSRGRFEQISAAVRSDKSDWRGIKLHVFDVPKAAGNLYQRKAGWRPTPKPPSPSYAKFPPATAPTLKPS